MFADGRIRSSRPATIALMVLLYGQGLLGLVAVTAVIMKDRSEPTPPPVVAASISPAQPAS